MRSSTILIAATGALFVLSNAGWSDQSDDFFDGVAAKLYGAGYSQVHLVDADRQLLSAYDGTGSEVLIFVNAFDGNVVSVTHVHAADQ